MHQAVSCSILLYLWTGSSSPVASHPAFRRRSFLRLRTASVLSDGDFHPTVGAHSQAHVGMRSRASGAACLAASFWVLQHTRSGYVGEAPFYLRQQNRQNTSEGSDALRAFGYPRGSGRVTAIAHRNPPTPPDMPFSASGG